eukprot:Hpha_TRINITY_DN4442_c0_g1::TRINITY_DN4442_c0_g1_i1::g.50447::m.50447
MSAMRVSNLLVQHVVRTRAPQILCLQQFRCFATHRGLTQGGAKLERGRAARGMPIKTKHGKKQKKKREKEESSDEEVPEDLPALNAVVKVFTTHSEPDFSLPWQKQPQYRSSGTGFIIEGRGEKFVLTNAHCVEYATQVQLKRRGDDAKFAAKLLAIGWECDLALLQVEDESFYEEHDPVPFSRTLPRLEDPVMCVGYPVGGETMSVTSGVVSRVEVTEYTQGNTGLLGIQIDAAINSGNSGGPALNHKGQVVGAAFQTMDTQDAENIGYVIPNAVIEHFLRDVAETGHYRGFPSLGLGVQNMENETLREAHKMKPRERGILVRTVDKTGCCEGKVLPGDVLLSFNNQMIGYDATVPLRPHERVSYTWAVAQRYVGDEAELEVLRDGERIKHKVVLSIPYHIVPNHLPEGRSRPSYFIVGGIVLTSVTEGYLKGEFCDDSDDDWEEEAPITITYVATHTKAERPGQELVVIAQILAHNITTGYEDLEHGVVEKINGQKVESLADVVEKVRDVQGDYIRIDLREARGVIVLPVKAAKDAMAGLLEEHCIPSCISEDLAHHLAHPPPAPSDGELAVAWSPEIAPSSQPLPCGRSRPQSWGEAPCLP